MSLQTGSSCLSTLGPQDVLRGSDGVVAVAGRSLDGNGEPGGADETARPVSCNNADVVDCHVVAVPDRVGRQSQALDSAQIVPRAVFGDVHAIDLRSSSEDDISRPLIGEGGVAEWRSSLEQVGIERFGDDRVGGSNTRYGHDPNGNDCREVHFDNLGWQVSFVWATRVDELVKMNGMRN